MLKEWHRKPVGSVQEFDGGVADALIRTKKAEAYTEPVKVRFRKAEPLPPRSGFDPKGDLDGLS
jgi:hypothetical protein